jgi:hypothetical protein
VTLQCRENLQTSQKMETFECYCTIWNEINSIVPNTSLRLNEFPYPATIHSKWDNLLYTLYKL